MFPAILYSTAIVKAESRNKPYSYSAPHFRQNGRGNQRRIHQGRIHSRRRGRDPPEMWVFIFLSRHFVHWITMSPKFILLVWFWFELTDIVQVWHFVYNTSSALRTLSPTGICTLSTGRIWFNSILLEAIFHFYLFSCLHPNKQW